jgi:adenosylmethionine-8-amino-7-oxononanoate aminotransferase
VACRILPRSSGTAYPTIVRAEGSYLFDDRGRRILDASAGAVVCNIGHGRPEIAEIAGRQILDVDFVHGSQFVTAAYRALAEQLGRWLPDGDWRYFATSGGSEATEAAIKFARQVQVERGYEGRVRVLSRTTSYHGASLGALAASGRGSRRDLFGPMVRDASFPKIPKPDPTRPVAEEIAHLEHALEAMGPETVAAVLVEPVMGAADPALAPGPGYYGALRAVCDRHGVLFIADEVMCGLGRTGTRMGIEAWGTVPDVVVLGKGLAAGYAPLGGICVREDSYASISDGSGTYRHGYTYSGHPVSTAVGAAVLRILEDEDLVDRAAETGSVLMDGLRSIASEEPRMHEVRGHGMLLGVVLRDPATGLSYEQPGLAHRIGAEARERGLNLYPGTGAFDGTKGDHVLIGPPLTLSLGEADELLAKFAETMRAVGA